MSSETGRLPYAGVWEVVAGGGLFPPFVAVSMLVQERLTVRLTPRSTMWPPLNGRAHPESPKLACGAVDSQVTCASMT